MAKRLLSLLLVMTMMLSLAAPAYGLEAEPEEEVEVTETVSPDPAIAARYEVQYKKFRAIYPAVKELFPVLNIER